MIEGVGTALGDEVVHGNALLLGDGAQAAHKVFRQAKGLVYHFRLLHIKHWNPPSYSILCMIFDKIHTLKTLYEIYNNILRVNYTCKTLYTMIEYFTYKSTITVLYAQNDG